MERLDQLGVVLQRNVKALAHRIVPVLVFIVGIVRQRRILLLNLALHGHDPVSVAQHSLLVYSSSGSSCFQGLTALAKNR